MTGPDVAGLDVGHHGSRAGETCVVEALGAKQIVEIVSADERALLMSR